MNAWLHLYLTKYDGKLIMKNSRHFKQIILFLLTILLPSLGLIFLTVRMVRQEKELAERRGSEARHLVARQIGDELLI